MASIGAARRTQSSYPAFLRSTNPSDLTVSSYGVSANSAANGYSADVTSQIARLPGVRRVKSWVGLFAIPLERDGAPNLDDLAHVNIAGSLDGLYFDEDRATAIAGRMARADRPNEFVTTAAGARQLGIHVGETVPMGFYNLAQSAMPGFGTAAVPPQVRANMRLVGVVVFNDQVIQDDADRLPTNMVFSPARTRSLLEPGGTQGTWYGLQLVHGNRDVPLVERAIIGLFPPGSAVFFRVTSLGEAKVERAVKPEAIALGAFGAIAALAALLIAAQAISRQLHESDEDMQVLRSLGADPSAVLLDGLVGILAAVGVGALLACALAIALSPLAPLGPVRAVYPSSGIAFDWTVLGGGTLVLIVALNTVATALAYRSLPHRVARRSKAVSTRTSSVVRAAAASGLSSPGVVGVRFALEPGRGRTAVPVRSALSGAAVAVILVVATLTFGSSLHTLVSRPALYGWNWSYALYSVNNIPPQARDLLGHDPNVAATADENDLNVQIDGQNVPALLGDAHPALGPPILSGHALAGRDQVVLGAATLARLHKHVGDTVIAGYGTPSQAPLYVPPTRLLIVGTATLPAISTSGTLADHTSMGTGALLSTDIAPPAFQQAASNPDPTLNGPSLVVVQLRNGVSPAARVADERRIVAAANNAFSADPGAIGDTVDLLPIEHPAEIVNYRSTGATPFILAAGLALGAIVALGLTLTASVRRRRRDLALLKTLGFTRRQLAATVVWQSSVAAIVGLAVGIPVGIAAGRWLWVLFAREIYAVPKPTVPLSVLAVAVGTLLLANAVAAIPGRLAAGTPAALVLRGE